MQKQQLRTEIPKVETASSARWEVSIDHDWCKACSICIEVCPRNVFDRDQMQHPIIARIDDCIGCELCEQLCPDLAVKVAENGS